MDHPVSVDELKMTLAHRKLDASIIIEKKSFTFGHRTVRMTGTTRLMRTASKTEGTRTARKLSQVGPI